MRNFARRLKSFQAAIDEILFDPQTDTAKGQGTSVWLNVVPLILTTVLLNSAAFLVITGPQTVFQIATDTEPRIQRASLDIRMNTVFGNKEMDIFARQQRRVSELLRFSPADGQPRSQQSYKDFVSRSEQNQIEAARDIGTVAAFETIGSDWNRDWAKAQERAINKEMATWQAAQDVAETYLRLRRSNPQTREEIHRFKRQRLLLVSSIEEFAAYAEQVKPVGLSEVNQIQTQADAMRSRLDFALDIMKISVTTILAVCLLFGFVGGIWLVRKLQKIVDRREKELQKLTV
jgi:hypothetical protein